MVRDKIRIHPADRAEMVELNQLFLYYLEDLPQKAKHTSSGSNGRHPLLRTVWLRNFRDDLKTLGLEKTKEKWHHYLYRQPKSEPIPEPKGKRGRPSLDIALDLISDTLQTTRSIKETVSILGCSRGYLYQELGAEKVKELIK